MGEYVLGHHLEGERSRLQLMSRLLDPMHRRHVEALGVGLGARALEVGCGNGSVSAWLASALGRPAGALPPTSTFRSSTPGRRASSSSSTTSPPDPSMPAGSI